MELYKLMDEAMQLEEKGENDKALAIWKKAVAMEPENGKAQNGLGISLYGHGDVEDGFEHLRKAISVNPLSVESHYVMATFTLKHGHAEQAVPELKHAVEIRPHFASG